MSRRGWGGLLGGRVGRGRVVGRVHGRGCVGGGSEMLGEVTCEGYRGREGDAKCAKTGQGVGSLELTMVESIIRKGVRRWGGGG